MDKYTADQLDALKAKGHTFPGGTSYPIDDAEDLRNAIDAVGRGTEDHDALRRYIMKRAEEMGLKAKIPDSWADDGSIKRSDDLEVEVLGSAPTWANRAFLLDDLSIRADGTGRTVVAYAAVFGAPAEIRDQDGHYMETIDPVAFNKTVNERAGQIGVFYNHGKTLFGTPSERFSMPLGTPEEIRADGRGLLTVTRYNANPLADEVLESIRNGDIKGQSFSGRFISSKRTRSRSGGIDQIHRTEVALREYGPTPVPAYKQADIVGVRSDLPWDAFLASLTEDQRQAFHQLSDTASLPPSRAVSAASSTDTTTSAPAGEGHAGPTQDQRQRRARALGLVLPKGV